MKEVYIRSGGSGLFFLSCFILFFCWAVYKIALQIREEDISAFGGSLAIVIALLLIKRFLEYILQSKIKVTASTIAFTTIEIPPQRPGKKFLPDIVQNSFQITDIKRIIVGNEDFLRSVYKHTDFISDSTMVRVIKMNSGKLSPVPLLGCILQDGELHKINIALFSKWGIERLLKRCVELGISIETQPRFKLRV